MAVRMGGECCQQFKGTKIRSLCDLLINRPQVPSGVSYIECENLWLNIVLSNLDAQLLINPQHP